MRRFDLAPLARCVMVVAENCARVHAIFSGTLSCLCLLGHSRLSDWLASDSHTLPDLFDRLHRNVLLLRPGQSSARLWRETPKADADPADDPARPSSPPERALCLSHCETRGVGGG